MAYEQFIVPAINVIGFSAAIFVFAKNGGNLASQATITAQKEQIAIQDRQIAQMHTDMQALHQRMGELSGELAEKDKRISNLENVSIDRNPQFEAFMKLLAPSAPIAAQADTFMSTFMQEVKPKIDALYDKLVVSAPS